MNTNIGTKVRAVFAVGIILALGTLADAEQPNADAVLQAPKPLGNPSAPQNGTFYFNLGLEPTTLNPITGTDAYNQTVQSFVLDSLLTRNDDTYEWESRLAETVEVSADGKTFTFTIREGATFHDGKPVTAEDVKFSLDVVRDPAYNAAHLIPYFEAIEKAEVVDARTVKFTTKTKYFGNFETVAGMSILPKHFYSNAKEGIKKNKTIIGSGPYKLETYEQGQHITLVRNPNWWGNKVDHLKGQHNFQKIFLRFVKEENIALEMLKKGTLDFDGLTAEAYMKKAVGPEWGTKVIKEKIENKAPKSFGYVGWNQRKEIFKDRDVRMALALLMNRELMNKQFRFGMSLPATGPWYQQSEYASPQVEPTPFDPKKAVQLLKKAGWEDTDKDGILDKTINGEKTNFSFTLMHSLQDMEKYWTLYQEDLKKVGVNMEIKLLEWNAFIKFLDDGNFDAVALGWGEGSVDLDPKQIWHSASAVKGGSNFINYKNPEVDKLIDQAREEMDKSKRIPILRKVYEMIADDAPYAFMFNERYALYAHNKRIKMVEPTYSYSVGRSYWWIAQ